MKTENKRKSLVKLTGLRSTSREHQSSKSINKQINDIEYQKVRYFSPQLNIQSYNYVVDLYQELQRIFAKYNTFQPFSNISSILSKSRTSKTKKILTILPLKGFENLQEIIKSLEQNNDLILVGQVQPNGLYLKKCVVLVTNSGKKIFDFLDSKHQLQYPLKLELQSFIRSQQTFNNNYQIKVKQNELIGIKSYQPISDQPVVVNVNQNEYQIQRKQIPTSPENKPKIKKLKSPTKSRPNTESSDQPSSLHNVNNSVYPPSPGLIVQTNEFQTNKQAELLPKVQDLITQPYSAPAIRSPLNMNASSSASSIKEILQPQTDSYLMKKVVPSQNYNQISNKYKSSYVIPETSDQYRGSNKDSLLNQQFDKSRQQTYQISNYMDSESKAKHYTHLEVSGPLQERGEKKMVHSLMNNFSNFPERQVLTSSQKIRDFRKQGVVKTIMGPQAIQRALEIDEMQKPKIIKKTDNIAPLQVQVQTETNINQQQIAPSSPKNEMKTTYNQMSNYNTSYPTNYLQNIQKNTHNNYHISSPSTQTKNASTYQNTNVRVIQGNISPLIKRQVIKSPQVRVFGGTSPSTTIKNDKTNYAIKGFNLEGYERVQVNGIAMYRKKTQVKPVNIEAYQNDGSPKVIKYEVSPRQNLLTSSSQAAKISSNEMKGNRYSPYTFNTYNTLNSYSNQRPIQNNQQVLYNRSSTYLPSYYTNTTNYEVPKTVQNNMGNTISSYKPTENEYNVVSFNRQLMKPAVQKQNVSIKILPNQDEFIEKLEVGVQREIKQKAEVQRREYKELKVQSPNLRLLNDSNWLSKPSDLHSDGSILRRNNIRFGIKLKQKQQKLNQSCVNQTKLQNGIFNINDLNKQMALHRKIQGEEEITSEEKKYIHINTQLSAIHYLFQEELRYYEKKLNVLFGTNDKVDFFSCIEELSQKAYSLMDCGFVIMIKEEGQKVNASMLPEDYYVIFIDKSQDALLQIDGDNKKIRVDSLERLTLAQKIILDSKLYQYIIYKGGDALVEGLGDKFANTQFIAEKLQIQLSNQILDCYYEDQPRLTRLYILCLQQQLKNTLKVIETYQKTNPFFNKASCKVICPLKNSTNLQKLVKGFPSVLFLTTLSLSYKQIITQAHKGDKKIQLNIKPDRLYLHQKQSAIAADLEKQFPGRFQIIVFESLQSIAKKTNKYQLQKFNSYLVLSDSVSVQKLVAQNFTKVFMMGRAKALPNNVVRVMKKEELLQLLKK